MIEPAYNLRGRAALITGANQGLGRSIASHYVRAGASVLLTARDNNRLQEVKAELQSQARSDQKVLARAGDVADRQSCDEIVKAALQELPAL